VGKDGRGQTSLSLEAILFRWKVPEPALIDVAAAVGLVLHHA